MKKNKLVKMVAIMSIFVLSSMLVSGCSKSKFVYKAFLGFDTTVQEELINKAKNGVSKLKNSVTAKDYETAKAYADEIANKLAPVAGKLENEAADKIIEDMTKHLSYVISNEELAIYIAGNVSNRMLAEVSTLQSYFKDNEAGKMTTTVKYSSTETVDEQVYFEEWSSHAYDKKNVFSTIIGDKAMAAGIAQSDAALYSLIVSKLASVDVKIEKVGINNKNNVTRSKLGITQMAYGSGYGSAYTNSPELFYYDKYTDGRIYVSESQVKLNGEANYLSQDFYAKEIANKLRNATTLHFSSGDSKVLKGAQIINEINDNYTLKGDSDTSRCLLDAYAALLSDTGSGLSQMQWAEQNTEALYLKGYKQALKNIQNVAEDLAAGKTIFSSSDSTPVFCYRKNTGSVVKNTNKTKYLDPNTNAYKTDYSNSDYVVGSFLRAGADSGNIYYLTIHIKFYGLVNDTVAEQAKLTVSNSESYQLVNPEANKVINNMFGGQIFALSKAKVKTTDFPTVASSIASSYSSKVMTATSMGYFDILKGSGSDYLVGLGSGKELTLGIGERQFVKDREVPLYLNTAYIGGSTDEKKKVLGAKILVNTFDEEAFNDISATMTDKSSKYLVYYDGDASSVNVNSSSTKMYLIQYPVLGIKEFVADYDNGTWQANYLDTSAGKVGGSSYNIYKQNINKPNDTGMEINLGDGALYVRTEGSSENKKLIEFTGEDIYYVGGSGGYSFALGNDKNGVAYRALVTVGDKKLTVGGVPSIVLTDYLEGVYLPREEDTFTCFGRRIRVTNLDGSLTNSSVVGMLMDKNGQFIEGGNVKITNLISASTDSNVAITNSLEKLDYYSGTLAGIYGTGSYGNGTNNNIVPWSSLDGTTKGEYKSHALAIANDLTSNGKNALPSAARQYAIPQIQKFIKDKLGVDIDFSGGQRIFDYVYSAAYADSRTLEQQKAALSKLTEEINKSNMAETLYDIVSAKVSIENGTTGGNAPTASGIATVVGLDKLKGIKVKLLLDGSSGYSYSNSTVQSDLSGNVISNVYLSTLYGERVQTGKFASGQRPASASNAYNVCVAATVDIGKNEQKPKMFAICTDMTISDSKLSTTWIDADDTGEGSLEWWNNWLDKNEYTYRIDMSEISQLFNIYYKFDMAKDGYVILDEETIELIQKTLDEETNKREANLYKTVVRIIGIVMIFYGLLLLVCWAIDINVEGIGALKKITLGNLIAVQDDENLPPDDDVRYMTFSKILKMTLIISGVGLILATTNIIWLIGKLIEAFSGILQWISKLVFNK